MPYERTSGIKFSGDRVNAGGRVFSDAACAIEYEWVPEPAVIARMFANYANYLKGNIMYLEKVGIALKLDMLQRFEAEVSPGGQPWAPWSTIYGGRARGRGQTKILDRTSELKATAPEGYHLAGNAIYYSTAGLPYYWHWMEGGATQHFTTSEGDIGTADTPARPFIGLSADEIAAIETAWEAWVLAPIGGVGGAAGYSLRFSSLGKSFMGWSAMGYYRPGHYGFISKNQFFGGSNL